jgi:hypothetical protein
MLVRRDLRRKLAEIAHADEARLVYWRLSPAVQ